MSTERQLIENIKRAWANVPYPGDENIFTSDSYDDEGITEYFSGTTWEGHSVEGLRDHSSAISTFFTPAAYNYWLPAYLIAAIKDPDELSQGIDCLISSLTPENRATRFSLEQRERLGLLTNKQKLILIEVIEYIVGQFEDSSHPEWTKQEIAALSSLYATTTPA